MDGVLGPSLCDLVFYVRIRLQSEAPCFISNSHLCRNATGYKNVQVML